MQEQPQQRYEGAERRHSQVPYDGEERRKQHEDELEYLEQQDVRQRDDTQ